MIRLPAVVVGVCGGLMALSSAGTSITWTKVGSGSWGDASVWSTSPSLPAFDGTEDAFVGSAAAAYNTTYTLNGDRHVNSLTIQGTYKTVTAIGTPSTSRLRLASGNITKTSTTYHDMQAPVQLGNGTSAVTGIWSVVNSALSLTASGKIHGAAGCLIRKQGNIALNLAADSSATYAGDWSLEAGNVVAGHALAMGSGAVSVSNPATLSVDATRTLANAIVCASGDAGFSANNGVTLTLSGPISGPGRIAPGTSNNYLWALKLTSPQITSTGGLTFGRACSIVFCGTWTDCGNIVLNASYSACSLQGNGTIGMAAGKTLTTTSSTTLFPYIAPGNGTPTFAEPYTNTVGTLTIGTAGNSNTVSFGTRARYAVDVRPTGSDRLIVRGAVTIDATDTQLMLYGALVPTSSYTLMDYASRSGKFARVYWNGVLVASPEAKDGVNGTHTLVYGAAGLQLVGRTNTGTVIAVR